MKSAIIVVLALVATASSFPFHHGGPRGPHHGPPRGPPPPMGPEDEALGGPRQDTFQGRFRGDGHGRPHRGMGHLAKYVFKGKLDALEIGRAFHDSPDAVPTEKDAAGFARKLIGSAGFGNVGSTISLNGTDFPFSSVDLFCDSVPSTGNPIFLLSPMEVTLQDVESHNNEVSLAVRQDATGLPDPLLTGRATLVGKLNQVPDSEVEAAEKAFLDKHPEAKEWVDLQSHGFHFYQMEVEKVHWIGGFGDTHYIGWVSTDLYREAQP